MNDVKKENKTGATTIIKWNKNVHIQNLPLYYVEKRSLLAREREEELKLFHNSW